MAEHDLVTSAPGTRSPSPWASVVAAFAFHAAVAGSLGPRFPAIKERTDVSDSGLGIALVGFAAGLFVGTRLAARPLRRFGSRPVLRLGVPLFAASLLGPAFARDLVSLTAALLAMGLVSGLLDVAMNANAVVVERRAGRPIMSGIHGVWSAGLLASSGAAVVAAALDTSLLLHFGIVAAVIAIASVPLLRGLLGPAEEGNAGERARHGGGSVSWAAVLPLGIIGFCSFLGEGSMHDWSAVYLNETLGTSPAIAALGFAGFALGMTASRFVADRLIVRYGSVRVVRAGGLTASAGLLLGLAIPGAAAAIVGFTVLGAALAPVVPTVFSAAGNLGAGATALGWVVTISYVGGILGPGLIGFTAQVTGLRTALGIPAALALVIAALAGRVVTTPGSSHPDDVPPAPSEGPW